MIYNIADIFYSIQGEGIHTGVPMGFIRLAGCNINCEFCDTDYRKVEDLDEFGIIARIEPASKVRRVVITGGEPLMQDLKPLCNALRNYGHIIHLETNGSIPFDRSLFDWVAVSPKNKNVLEPNLIYADEIKLLYKIEDFDILANRLLERLYIAPCMIMPLEEGSCSGNTSSNKKDACNYVLKNPRFRLCAQVHKLYSFK